MLKYSLKEYGYYNYSSNYFVSMRSRTFKPRPYREYFARVYTDVISFLEKVTLIDSNILANPESIENKTWPRILSKRLDKLIVDMIREEFETSAEDITYMPIGGTTALALKLSKTTIRVDDLGDGARSAILTASILLTLNNTAVLMEELENHQHPGGLRAVMNFVLKVAKDKKLQLFISTHSIELLNILYKLCKDAGLGFKTFFLERDGEGKVDVRALKRIDVNTLLKLGLDPRFLDVMYACTTET